MFIILIERQAKVFEKLSFFATFIKELATSQNLTLHLSAATTFGTSLILLWLGLNTQTIILSILFVFPTIMSLGLGLDKIILWRKDKKLQAQETIIRKMGYLGDCRYTFQSHDLWPDQKHKGMGWVILVNTGTKVAFLQNPVCLKCKTDLTARINEKCTGVFLECPDCNARFDVDDIGEKRALANASLQGDARKNPDKYFDTWI